jgi:hypothetical protein
MWDGLTVASNFNVVSNTRSNFSFTTRRANGYQLVPGTSQQKETAERRFPAGNVTGTLRLHPLSSACSSQRCHIGGRGGRDSS